MSVDVSLFVLNTRKPLKTLTQRTTLTLCIAVLLIFWAARVLSIEAFPPFIDEAFHINFGKNIAASSLFMHAEEGRQLTVWLYLGLAAYANEPIFVARVATLLTVMVGLAAFMATARLFAGRWGMLFAGLLYTFSTYHFFFERMALADPIANAATMVGLYFAARLVRRVEWRDALLCGLALFIAFGAKVLALPYLAIPLAAALFLGKYSWPTRIRWGAVALSVGVGLSIAFIVLLRWRGHDPFFYLLRATPGGVGFADTLVNRLPTNIQTSLTNLTGFTGAVGFILLVASAGILIVKRQFFLPTCALLPVLVYWLNNRPDTRHFIIPLSLLLLCAAVVIAQSEWRRVGFAAILIIGVLQWLPFAFTTAYNPTALPVPESDYQQYLASDASGTSLKEVVAYLDEQKPQRVIALLANCLSLQYVADDTLTIECPRINPDGSTREGLANLLHDNVGEEVYVVLEESSYLPAEAPGTLLTTIERPHNGAALRIYSLTPS